MSMVETNRRKEKFKGKKGKDSQYRNVGCAIFFLRNKWKLIKSEIVDFNNLASSELCSPILIEKKKSTISPFQGLNRSFLKHNFGLLTIFEHNDTSQTVVVVNCHLHWNPAYEYVKLCQAHYLMERVKYFSRNQAEIEPIKRNTTSDQPPFPIILCGDLNSPPGSPVHKYLVHGEMNARLVSPWYVNGYEEQQHSRLENDEIQTKVCKMVENFRD